MPSAIDVFREQREAAEQLHTRVQEISALLERVRQQVSGLALNEDLRTVLREEQTWLTRAQVAISEVRSFREQDMLRFWPSMLRRWTVALVFRAGVRGRCRRGLRMGNEAVRRRTCDTSVTGGVRRLCSAQNRSDEPCRTSTIRQPAAAEPSDEALIAL